jgi:hypothetical protein
VAAKGCVVKIVLLSSLFGAILRGRSLGGGIGACDYRRDRAARRQTVSDWGALSGGWL